MDPYLLIVKYILNKNEIPNTDINLKVFFSNGISFPQFISAIYKIKQIPGIVKPQNKFQIANNNKKALAYLSQNNHFFQLFSIDFDNEKNQVSLIQLILRKVYFNTNRVLFLKKCNDFIKPSGKNISDFSEFIHGKGFIKLLNVISNGSILKKIKTTNDAEKSDILTNYFKSLNIPTVIDKTSFMPINHDLLMYQALIIIESYNKKDFSIKDETKKDLNEETKKQNNISLKNDEDENTDINANCDEQKNTKILVDFKEDQIKLIDNKNSNYYIKNHTENHICHDENESSDFNEQDCINKNEKKISNFDEKDNNIENHDNLNNCQKIELDAEDDDNVKDKDDDDDDDGDNDDGDNDDDNDGVNDNDKKRPDFNENKENHVCFDKNENISLTENNNSNILSSSFFQSSEILNLPKLSYLNIVNNIMELNSLQRINDISDFEKGSILPNLIEICLNEKIPNIVKNPTLPYDSLMNNMNALFFLAKNDPSFKPRNYNFTQEKDMQNLIQYLLMKYVFTEKYQNQMKIECNQLLTKNSININNFKEDWDDGTNFVALLNILSKGEIAFPHESELDINSLKDLFMKAKCAVVLEDDAIFGNSIEYIILYQVKLILDEMRNKGMLKSAINVLKITGNKRTFIEINEDKRVPYVYVKDSFPVLRLLNFLVSKIGLHYDSLDDVVNGLTLPLLVQYLMEVETIPCIVPDEKFALTNFNNVIHFLKKNNDAFKYSTFNFDDPEKRDINIIWFCDILLREYYVKDTKIAVFENASKITGIQINFKNLKEQFIYGNYFYYLLDYDKAEAKNYYDEELLLDLFQKIKVPFILDNNSLTNINEDYICFQLKLIFDYSIKKFNCHAPKKVIIESNEVDEQPLVTSNEPMESTYDQISKLLFNISDIKVDDFGDESEELNIDTKFSKIENIPNNDSVKNQIKTKLDQMFQNLTSIANIKKIEADKNGKKNNNDKNIDLYRLYEYKWNKWVYDELVISHIKEKYNMSNDDIIHFMLLLPCCTANITVQNDEFYHLVSSISGCKINGSITNDAYVELGFCGNLKDIQKRFGINCITNQNQEFLILMQLRYPPSFTNVKSIDRMQTALSIFSQYIILTLPKNNIEGITHFINTSLYQIFNNSSRKWIETGMSYLLEFDPSSIIKEKVEITQNKKFLNQLESFLNQDKKLLKTVRNFCDKVYIKIQWINDKYLDSYMNFLEIALHYCQKNIQKVNKVYSINYLLKRLGEINLITDDNDPQIMNNLARLYYNIGTKKENSFLKYLNSNIIFDSNIWDEFISSNKIDIESLYTIFFCFSDPNDVKYVMQIFQKENNKQSYTINHTEFIANIQYCGDINELIDFYDINKSYNFKKKKKNGKVHLAYIFILNLLPNSKKLMNDLLFFETMIASQCDIVITIPNKNIFEAQMHFAEKLINAKFILDIINKKNTNKEIENCFILINEYHQNINSSNIDFSSLDNIPSHLKKIKLNAADKKSCSSFLETLIDQMLELNINRKVMKFTDLQNDYNTFYVNIFNNIKKIKIEKEIRTKKERLFNHYRNIEHLFNFFKNDDDNDIVQDEYESKIITYYEYNISDIDFENTIHKVLFYFIEKMPKDYSVNIIEKYFIHTVILLRDEKDIVNILMKMKAKIMEKYIDYVAHDYIEELITIDLVSSFRINAIIKSIKKSKIYFDQDFINYMKDYFERRIENEIYYQAERYCIENEKSADLKYLIGKRVYDLYEASNLFQKCRDKIQECYIEAAKYKQADIQLNQEEIGQDSMKYVLNVKESIKEMTVEISREEDLEREIPQDF